MEHSSAEHNAYLQKQMRLQYEQVYHWLAIYGLARVEERKSNAGEWSNYDESKYNEYKNIIQTMQPPGEATAEEMYALGNHLVSGVLEMNFTEQIGSLHLGNIGRSIVAIYHELEETGEAEKLQDTVYGVKDAYEVHPGNYAEYAMEFYRSFPHDGQLHLGGLVALADTNWEVNRLNPEAEKVYFRKPAAVHFKELDDSDNLFRLAKSGQLIIQSIIVK